MKKRLGEKREEKINKSEILSLLSILIIVGFLAYVFGAAAFITSPLSRGNYSQSILLNCTTTLNSTIKGHNATFYYNASGGATLNITNLTGTIWNTTANWSMFNATADISGLADSKWYNISCFANNGTDFEWTSINVTIDNTPPAVVFATTNISNNGNYSNNTAVVINVSVSDATIGMNGGCVYFNISNSSNGLAPTGNMTKANLTVGGDYYNATVSMSAYPDGVYQITVLANDSLWLRNASLVPKVNLNNTESINFTIDRTAPSSVTLANTTSTTTTQTVVTITAVDATSGIDNCVAGGFTSGTSITGRGTGTQTLTHTGLTCGTAYNYIVTCYDQVGNSLASTQTSLSTSPCTVSDSGVGAGAGAGVVETKTQSWTKITPGVASIMKNFGPEVGVKQIEITVSNEAQNVKITVIKYEGQPAEVTVEKTGKVYGYLQVTTQNLGEKLEKAKMTVQVAKSWISENSVDKENVALFKFDETSSDWNELTTTFTEEDDDYYYYEAEVTSFSYFAIGEKAVIEEEEEEAPEIGEQIKAALTKKTWLWIVIGVIALVIVGVLVKKKKK